MKRFEDLVVEQRCEKGYGDLQQKLWFKFTLRREALENQRYRDELEAQNRFYNPTGPHYKINIASVDNFIGNYTTS